MNISMLLEMSAESFPDRVALTVGEVSMTYAELLVAANAAAGHTASGNYDVLGFLGVNSLAVPIALFGAALAGVPYVPMNYRLTRPELEDLLARISPALLVANRTIADALTPPTGIKMVSEESFLALASRSDKHAHPKSVNSERVAVQLFTSGTTGKPKAAILRHKNLVSYILETVEFGAADEEDATLISVPPYHVAGISAVLSSTYACRRMVQLPNFDAAEWLRLCARERITNAFLVPTMLSRIVDHLVATHTKPNLPQLRAVAYGGGKMPLSVIERAMDMFPNVEFTNAYGLTETSSTICLLGPEDHRLSAASDEPAIRKRMISVGKPIGSVEIEIRDESGARLGRDQSGDIFVRGSQVSGEYLGVGSLLDDDGWFATRDKGYVDRDGYVFLEGRADDVIVRGGENISPGEIEDILLEHPAVREVAVVAVPDEQWGETVGAAVVVGEGASVAKPELQNWVKTHLRSSRVPAHILFVDELPFNINERSTRRFTLIATNRA